MQSEGERLNKCHELVSEFIEDKLYPPDKRDGIDELDYSIGVITSFGYHGMWFVYLDTTLPDDVLYRVSFANLGTSQDDETTLIAYKKLEEEDLK